MSKLYLSFLLLASCLVSDAQPVLSNGFGYMAAINGNTYTKTANVGTGRNYSNVSASQDGQYFFAGQGNKVFYIDVATNAFVDSMTLPASLGEYASSNEANTLFAGTSAHLYRINTLTKSVDSVLTGPVFRIEERPYSKEVWVSADSMVHVVDYTSGLSASSFKVSSSKFDNGDIRFTKGGTMAFKALSSRKKILIIDAATRAIVDSIDTAPLTHQFAQVSTDSTRLFATTGGYKIYVYSLQTKALVDSIISNRLSMNIYRHPTRQEIWAIDHFADSVVVFDEQTYSMIAGIPIGPDPFFLAFSNGTLSVPHTAAGQSAVQCYPNPAVKELNLRFDGSGKRTLSVYDLSGRLLRTTVARAPEARLDVSAYAPGTYILIVKESGKADATIPFRKE